MQQSTVTPTQGEITWGEPRTSAVDFIMIDATTQDANNFELALLYLQDSPTASSWIDHAAEIGNLVDFNHGDLDGNVATADGVGWNPDVGIYLENSGEIMSPAITLASEFGHVVLEDGLTDLTTPDPVWGSPSEGAAHQATNVIAGELGEPIRDNYFDVAPVNVPDITSHGSLTEVYGDTIDTSTFNPDNGGSFDTIDTSGLGTYDASGFDAGSFAADYGVADFGYDSSFGNYGSESYGGADSFGFDSGSFASDYGIGDFSLDSFGGGSGGGGGGGFSTDTYMEYMVAV